MGERRGPDADRPLDAPYLKRIGSNGEVAARGVERKRGSGCLQRNRCLRIAVAKVEHEHALGSIVRIEGEREFCTAAVKNEFCRRRDDAAPGPRRRVRCQRVKFHAPALETSGQPPAIGTQAQRHRGFGGTARFPERLVVRCRQHFQSAVRRSHGVTIEVGGEVKLVLKVYRLDRPARDLAQVGQREGGGNLGPKSRLFCWGSIAPECAARGRRACGQFQNVEALTGLAARPLQPGLRQQRIA